MSRWSRGCGTGIGLSGHTNQYRHGVTIENWVEDTHAISALKNSSTLLGTQSGDAVPSGDEPLTSTYMRSFISEGKTGSTITEQADRKDKDAYTGKSKNNLFDHSDSFLSAGETGEYYVTLNELVYKAPNEDKTRTVSQHLWMGSKFNDLEVERKSERQPVRTSMRRGRIDEMKHTKPSDAFRTHSNEVAEASIKIGQTMSEDGEPVRSKQILPMAEGGQRAQIGRKAVGDCAKSLDASYRNIGLRK